jgi:hypothetical protein
MPSTTIIAQPGQLMPAYNPIKYIINNTNKNEPGFRYIFTIYPAIGSHIPANVVAQYKVLPVYGTGYGEQDISLLMQSLVTYNETGISYVEGGNAYNSSESWYQYDVDLGYEYLYNIDYTASLQESGGGDVEIHFNAHGFVFGDQVIVVQAAGGIAANPTVEGLHTVLYADTNYFVINARWDTVGDEFINGNVTYADQRKTVVLNDALITNKEVFNGAYNNNLNTSYADSPFLSADYLANGANARFMTSNDIAQFSPAAFYGAQIYYNLRVYGGATYTIRFYNMSNTFLDQYSFTPASDGIWAVFVGPNAPVGVDYYVTVSTDLGGFSMAYHYFTYDNRCPINQTNQLIYLDRMGSWQTFAFQLRTYEKGQITREQYNQHIDGQVAGSQWVGENLQKGSKTYNTNVTKTFDLNTNWMGQYDADRFQELLTSPQVYYSFNEGEIFAACVVEASTFEVYSQKNKKLIKQSVTIRLAQQEAING